jgi:hypothetical protein
MSLRCTTPIQSTDPAGLLLVPLIVISHIVATLEAIGPGQFPREDPKRSYVVSLFVEPGFRRASGDTLVRRCCAK